MGFSKPILIAAMSAALALGASACGGSGGVPGAAAPSAGGPVSDLMLYPLSSGAATPYTSPPPGTPGALNENVAFTVAGAQSSLLVYQSSYTGTFTISQACETPSMPSGATGVATATLVTSTGPAAVLNVQAGSNGGTCVFTITGGASKTATVFVGNTVTTGSVN